MTLTKSLLIVTLASGTLWAQAPAKTPTGAVVKPSASAKPAAAKPAVALGVTAKPAAAPVKAAPAKTTAAPAAVLSKKPETKPTAKPAPVTAKSGTEKHVAPVKSPFSTKKAPKPEPKIVQNASVKESQTATRVRSAADMPGRRDPFVSPIVRATTGGPGASCATGKRCLMVDQIQLMGIVKSANGFIAVVENAAKRSYFLRENDPIFNGSVAKITGDTVVFREQTVDKLGKQGVREVVKKVNAPVV